jgi:tetratricopeptide (TPR) repeat protein
MIMTGSLLRVSTRLAGLLIVLLLVGCSSPEQKAQNYYDKGMQFLSKQDYAKASIEFRNAIQLKKDMIGAWRGLLEVELHNKNIPGAIPILTTIVELDPKDMESNLKLGHFLLMNNAFNQALDRANAALALDDRNATAHGLKSAVLLRLNDPAGAIREAQTTLDIDPSNAEAVLVLAAERQLRGDTEGALALLNRPVKKNDEFAIDVFRLRLYEKLGDFKQVEILLRKLVELYPFDSALQQSLVALYVKQKRYDDAEKELRALAAAKPSDVTTHLELVRFVLQLKGPAAARQDLLTFIDKAGDQKFKYQLALADFDLSQGKVADSIQLLESLISSARSSEDIVAAQLKLAQIQFQQKKFDAAEELVSSVLRRDSRNLDGLKLRAGLRLQKGQLEVAIADLRQALDDQPRSNDLMLLLASAYERSGSMDLAEKQYADATRVSNFDLGVTMNYVAFLRRRGSNDRAEDVLTQLVGRWPSNVPVLSALAEVRLARQNWSGAQEIGEAIKRIDNANAQGVGDQVLAAALSGQGKYGDSIKVLEKLQSATPDAPQPMAVLVGTMVRAQKFDQAIDFLRDALKKNPENAEAYVLLGGVYLLKAAPDEAEQAFRKAIERQPKNMGGYIELAQLYARQKKFDEAEKIANAGLKEKPDSIPMVLAYAAVLEMKGDYDGAISQYEVILKQDPGSLVAANNLASLVSDHRNDKASLERAYAVSAVLRKSQVPSFKDTLGWLDYLRGDYKSALGLLEEAAAALPDSPTVQYHLGATYIAIGQPAKAADQLKKALELSPDRSLQEKIKEAQKKAASN